ncbi:MAG: 3-oxoacyl-[acyl-carrier protein] reductase [Chloroflexota bacterium]|nr:3-oxoacyl-[acyl-carrier protein] reductase [Chloroflexota bacterium]
MSISVDLSGKVAIVTGAGRGIGRAIALALGKNGASVVLAARTRSQIEAVAQEITQAGGQALAVPCDLAEASQIETLFQKALEHFGHLDILVNNAAIGLYGQLAEFPTADLDRTLSINVRGTYLCCQQAMRRMLAQESGTILNISSVVGFKGYGNQSAYTASKHAVAGLTKSLAVEAQPHNIRVSVIYPGGTDTDLVGAARPDLDRSLLMQPEDVAHTVLYLLSLSERCAVDEIYIRRRSSSPF